MQTRDKIKDIYKISTKDLFTSDDSFNQELTLVNKLIPNLNQYKGKILDSSNNLLELLNLDNDLSKRIERLYLYAELNNDFDLSDEVGNVLMGNALKLYTDYGSISSYIIPELLKSDYSVVDKFIKENKALKEYAHTLKDIYRLKDHTLSESEELLLSKVSDSYRLPEEASQKLIDADLKFGKIKDENGKLVELDQTNYSKYMESFNRTVRKNTFKTFYKSFESINNTSATLLSAEVKNNNTIASIRHYPSTLNMCLYGNDVDPKVYDTLLKSIDKHIDIIHKEWDYRKTLLNLKELHIYDTYVPIINEFNKEFTFEEAEYLVLNALSILGDDYSKHLKEAFDNNWIDVYPSLNKRSGGYCTSSYLAHPYVFLNFDNRFNEVSTIAHELGHAMHYYYAQNNNTYEDYNYTIFVAEVASQVNEVLLNYYMFDNSNSKEEKLFYLDELIKHFKSSTVRQTMFAEFEKNIHEFDQNGTILTKELLNSTYYKLNQKYYGDSVIVDDEIKYEWSRIPHFYYDFYVYQYSTGYISALKIASDIYNKKENALKNYLEFLKIGNKLDPVSSLKVAGVDLTKEATFDDAFKTFDETLDKFMNLYQERSD